MLKKIFVPLALVAACALLLTACGGGSNNSAGSNNGSAPANANKTSTTSTPTTTSSPTTTAASGDKVGVPECDDFLAKYEACLTGKIPEAARPQFKAALEKYRIDWRKDAEDPQKKAGLAQGCKAALEQTKVSMKSFNCEF